MAWSIGHVSNARNTLPMAESTATVHVDSAIPDDSSRGLLLRRTCRWWVVGGASMVWGMGTGVWVWVPGMGNGMGTGMGNGQSITGIASPLRYWPVHYRYWPVLYRYGLSCTVLYRYGLSCTGIVNTGPGMANTGPGMTNTGPGMANTGQIQARWLPKCHKPA